MPKAIIKLHGLRPDPNGEVQIVWEALLDDARQISGTAAMPFPSNIGLFNTTLKTVLQSALANKGIVLGLGDFVIAHGVA